jgi:hypothetical protein
VVGQKNQQGPWPLVQYHRFVQGAFAAVITGQRATWEPMLRLVQLLDRNGSARASSRDAAFPELARTLAAAWLDSRSPECPASAADPFARLIASWADPVENAKAFSRALDYHLWRCDDRSSARNPDPTYVQIGIPLFPTHLIAYLQLRHQLGLVSLAIDHPMVSLPTFQPPDGVVAAPDAVLDSIDETLRDLS